MPLIDFNTPPPSSHLPRDESDATASVTEGSSLNHFPIVRLDVDVITDSIAGRLATSLLGHVLFLKSQIPL